MQRKTAFVTGASKVLGKAIALKLCEAGYDVGISYVSDPDGAAKAVERIEKLGGKAKAYQVDVRDKNRVTNIFADFYGEFGRFDLLVNNAGITRLVPFLEVEEDLYDEVMDINLKGAFFTAQSAARIMKRSEGGVIINLSSVHARGTWPGDTVYAVTKAAISRLTEAMALDLAEYGIRVAAVAPGYVMMSSEWSRQERISKAKGRIPLNRFVKPEEIGDACVFLASEKAAYITGTTLFVEGGALLPIVTDNSYT